jgi:L-lysine 2,3-aminomutase
VKRLLTSLAENKAQQAFILVHVNHPDELDSTVIAALQAIKRNGLQILSQTVMLRAINDDAAILQKLFETLYRIGILPYYLYRCDAVNGLERFVTDFDNDRKIVTELHQRLPGLAMPRFVVDSPGRGKLPVPLKFWEVPQPDLYVDFDGKRGHVDPAFRSTSK